MKAAPEDQAILLDVQRLDNDITRLAHRISSLQKGEHLTELGTRAAGLRSQLAAATGDVEDAERDLARLESDTATAQARIERDTTLLQGGVSTASGVTLTGADLQDVRRAAPDDVVLCPDSEAILVRTKESGL